MQCVGSFLGSRCTCWNFILFPILHTLERRVRNRLQARKLSGLGTFSLEVYEPAFSLMWVSLRQSSRTWCAFLGDAHLSLVLKRWHQKHLTSFLGNHLFARTWPFMIRERRSSLCFPLLAVGISTSSHRLSGPALAPDHNRFWGTPSGVRPSPGRRTSRRRAGY